MQKDAIRYLIGQYMNDELTAQQQVELLQLLSQQEETELIDVLRGMMEAAAATDAAVDAETMQSTLQRVLAADKVGTQARPGRLVNGSRWRWVAAAACLLVVGVAGYMLLNKKEQLPVTADVQPGSNKAILTLGNGKQIVLDSTGNGLLAQDGNAQVMQEKGSLTYESATGGGSAGSKPAIAYNTLTTPRGGEFKLTLPDGSKVWLNAASSLRYPTAFTGNSREVELEGEGYFEVAKNAAKPFHVITYNQHIEVLGTHFNVNGYKDEEAIKTTLLEGKVKIVNGQWSMANGRTAILHPGEQAVLKGNSPFTIDHSPDLDEVIAWTNGQFIFREQHIENIMKQISRWYNVDVVFAGKPTQEGFTASIPRNVPVSKVLRYLELTTLVHFKIDDKKITVLP